MAKRGPQWDVSKPWRVQMRAGDMSNRPEGRWSTHGAFTTKAEAEKWASSFHPDAPERKRVIRVDPWGRPFGTGIRGEPPPSRARIGTQGRALSEINAGHELLQQLQAFEEVRGSADHREMAAFKSVGQWMRGMNVERPAKREFDIVYSTMEDDDDPGTQKVLSAVERAAMRAGREEVAADASMRSTGIAYTAPLRAHAHPHSKKSHHRGRCGPACRSGRFMHPHGLHRFPREQE